MIPRLRPFPLLVACFLTISAHGVVEPAGSTVNAFRVAETPVPAVYRPLAALEPALADDLRAGLAELGVDERHAFYDLRSGRWATLVLRAPLVPGAGNALAWDGTAPADTDELGTATRDAFRGFLAAHRSTLGVELAELDPEPAVTVSRGGRLVQIHAGRRIDGVPVRRAYLTAVVSHGNLVLYGMRNWGDAPVDVRPAVSVEDARAVVAAHLDGMPIAGWRKDELAIEPMAVGAPLTAAPGAALDYRLVRVLRPVIAGDVGAWEALVDAHSGTLLAFEDTNHYQTMRRVKGGVLPESNDEVAPDGVEQPGWPMPFADFSAGGRRYAGDAGGNSPVCLAGEITTRLDARFVRMLDRCDPSGEPMTVTSNALLSGDVDLGTAPPFGTNCTPATSAETPSAATAPGNTRATRTGYYALNRIMAQARGQLPENPWLADRLTANVNIDPSATGDPNAPAICNAFWDGATVNFFQSSGVCNNTGELAGILDHEWGHGMDQNDAAPFVSSPGEGIADLYAALRSNDSCIGRNFSPALGCNAPGQGNGDPCTECDGVRDLDWAKRQSGTPHDVAWADAACGSGDDTPCGGSTHCEGAVYAEAVWDLLTRDLPCLGSGWVDLGGGVGQCAGGAAPAIDARTALELVTRLTYLGAGPVGEWFQCATDGTAGCGADGGYLNFLAADDDDGDLTNGTPHMSAIFAAFDRHQIACRVGATPVPAVVDAGCAGAPGAAPVLVAEPLDRGARLTWTAVAGAEKYEVFRAEGVSGCDAGKTRIGETTGLEWVDDGLANGFEYFYTVAPVGGAATCLGPMSGCAAVTPAPGANLAIDEGSVTVVEIAGDGDLAIDNCETQTLRFDLHATGSGAQTGVRIVAVEPVSHPATEILTPLPIAVAAAAADCDVFEASVDFVARGLSFRDPLVFRVDVTSDQMDGRIKTHLLELTLTESDFLELASKTFDFEGTLEDWTRARGTWTLDSRIPGAGGSATFLASSSDLPNQCDQILSPVVRLSPTSTLSLQNQYNIEGEFAAGLWYDRANVGVVDFATGERAPISPDGGRLYDVPDGSRHGTCGTEGQPGWAGTTAGFGTAEGWGVSLWSPAALGSAGLAGELVRLSVHYGTDPGNHLTGFWFDRVTLTDFELQVRDARPDVCSGLNQPPVAADDEAATFLNTPAVIDVLANDVDPDGDALAVTAVTQPAGGLAAILADGRISYTPSTGFSGIDVFTYTVSDSVATATATVTVLVEATCPVDVVFSDDVEGDTGNWLQTTGPVDVAETPWFVTSFDAHSPTRSWYVVNEARIKDRSLEMSLLVPIPADGVTELRFWHRYELEAGFDGGVLEYSLDGLVWTDILEGDPIAGIPDDPNRFTQNGYNNAIPLPWGNPLAGRAAFSGSSGVFVESVVDLTAFAGQPVIFRFRVGCDAFGAANGWFIDDVLITNRDVSPACSVGLVARPDAAETDEDVAVTIDVLANDESENGNKRVERAGDPEHGATVVNPDDTVTYTPDPGFWGVDQFDYLVCDQSGACAIATVAVTVHEINDPPVAVDDAAETGESVPVAIDVLANDFDPDGDPIRVADFTQPANGAVAGNPDGTLTYTPAPGFAGTDVFDYTVADDRDARDVGIVTVEVLPDPVASEGRVHGSGFLHGLTHGDGDADSDSSSDDSDSDKINFSFDARVKNGKFKGKLKLKDKELGVEIEAKEILSLSAGSGVCNGRPTGAGAFVFTAAGDWNGIGGATFRVCGEDNGKPGKGSATQPPDRFHLVCLSGCVYDTAARTPDDDLDGGNIHLHDPIVTGESSRIVAPANAKAAAEPEVLVLDPILLSHAPAGAPQLLTALLHAPDGVLLGGRTIVLRWEHHDGTQGAMSALTDAAGVAVFAITVAPDETEYWVETDDGLDSNRVAITGF